MKEYELMTAGERNTVYVNGHRGRLKNHLIPFFGAMGISQVTAGVVQDYRISRIEPQDDPKWKPPSRSTMHHEIVTLRQVLKTALRQGWIQGLPDLSAPYRTSGKVLHRAWFSHDGSKTLYTATRANIKTHKNTRHLRLAEQLHDKVLFMAIVQMRPKAWNTGMSRSLKMTPPARRSSKSKCAASAG